VYPLSALFRLPTLRINSLALVQQNYDCAVVLAALFVVTASLFALDVWWCPVVLVVAEKKEKVH
jgi:hypothetical protein